MKVQTWLSQLGIVIAGLALCYRAENALGKPVHLRDGEVISDPALRGGNLGASSSYGLFLIQLTNPAKPQWRKQLSDFGVELLDYIPENTFVARLRSANLNDVQQLEYVRWIQPYQPSHKMPPALLNRATQSKLNLRNSPATASSSQAINILLAPGCTPAEAKAARQYFLVTPRESTSRFGIILRGTINRTQLDALAHSEAVLWIEPAARERLHDEVASKIVAGDGGLHTTIAQSLGYDGSGVTVAVADSGLNNGDAATMHPDLFGRATNFLYYGTLTNAADENGHGTHIAGIIAGNGATGETDQDGQLYGLGVAPGASILTQRIFDDAGYRQATAGVITRDAHHGGAVIGSNSWGDDTHGDYDLTAREFDGLVRDAEEDNVNDPASIGDQPYILEFSAGNAGPSPQTLDSPAVGKNVIATGASQNNRTNFFTYEDGPEVMADFSSRGPCRDGRIKPDLVAPGTWIASLKSAAAPAENALQVISSNYVYLQGTSLAGPQVSGAAAVFVQYYRQNYGNATPSPALVKAALINSAVDMDNSIDTGPTPNMDEGWGRVNVAALVQPDRHFEFLDQSVLLTNGEMWQTNITIINSAKPFKITLTYTDVPGFPSAIPSLVNDLDLEVIAPDGNFFRGNQFDFNGESVPDAPDADRINNVEGVMLPAPRPGEYTVRVRAHNIVSDSRRDTPEIDQDFALVLSGSIPSVGESVVLFDRQFYTAPGQIGLKVIDPNKTNSASVNLLIGSDTETNGENLILDYTGTNGVFTGLVATATGPAMADGRLQIANADSIRASYFEITVATNRYATATADLIPPLLTGVAATNYYGLEVVTWQSDGPATSIINYGTNPTSLDLVVTNDGLTLLHSLVLKDLLVGQTYYFKVISADEAGNFGTNDQAGLLYSFIAQAVAPVLIVDAYIPDFDSPLIPLSSYTNALNQTGLGYEIWSLLQNNSAPSLAVLSRYRVVMWRVNDSYLTASPYSTLGESDQALIQDYLAGGGSFFMASMEILARLGDVPFRYDVLNVESYTTKDFYYIYCADCDEDSGVPDVQGQSGDPITAGMTMSLDYSNYPSGRFISPDDARRDLGDTFTLHDTGTQILLSSGRVVGMRSQQVNLGITNRVVFFSFPFDALPEADGTNNPAPNNRASLLRDALKYLAPGISTLGTVTLNAPAYQIPSAVTVTVNDANLIGNSAVSAIIRSSTDTNGILATLAATAQPGVFRSTIMLVAATNSPGAGILRAQNGDTLRADYFDASADTNIFATAIVDAQPPEISLVAGKPGYEEATVTWQTSEPADTQVQFGETPFLGRTAFNTQLNLTHEILLTGLSSDKTYYYRVVSRDAAGNTAVADNGGLLYTVNTMQSLTQPWADDLESAVTNWQSTANNASQCLWTLGVPENGLQSQAHSPTNAWGSNLHGDAVNFADTSLLSPAVLLTNGYTATLTFWHSYNFTNQPAATEKGQVFVLTNSLAAPALIAEYTNAEPAWTKVQLDLTPYLNRAVRLIWRYQVNALVSAPRPGWLLDDISLTVSNVATGVIQITNNLWQAQFALIGPSSRSGKGINMLITNALPGEYIIVYSNVDYYQPPASQTNTLVTGGNLTFTGDYTFVDANTNGIADAWEQAFFGTIASNHSGFIDTDEDGVSDYAEFFSGTNPTNATSRLTLTATGIVSNNTIRLDWPTILNYAYRLQGSTDVFGPWPPLTPWMQAVTNSGSFTLSATNSATLFRVEVQP